MRFTVTFPPLPYPKLVLDLVIPEGCKAEWALVVVRSCKVVLRGKAMVLWVCQSVLGTGYPNAIIRVPGPGFKNK